MQKAFASLTMPPMQDTSLASLVAAIRDLMSRYGSADAAAAIVGVDMVAVSARGVPCEYLVPRDVPNDAPHERRIVYLHGGAFIGGNLKSYRSLAAVLAKRANCPVLVVDYRLAPEYPFPAGLDDCLCAYDWATGHGPEGPAATSDIYLAGDSAGGNLAAAICLKRLEDHKTMPTGLALLSPLLDLEANSYAPRHDPLSGNETVQAVASIYLQDVTTNDNPLVSPVKAIDAVLSRFPPTLIQASTDEFLLHCSQIFANRLVSSGVRAILSTWPSMPHVWHAFLNLLPESTQALDEIALFFRNLTPPDARASTGDHK